MQYENYQRHIVEIKKIMKNIKTYIETAKNIAIGRMAVAIQRKKGNFRN